MTPNERARLQAYLRSKFDNNRISIAPRKQSDGSVEVMIADEFIGVIYKDEDEGEVSYAFHMAIIDIDLPEI
ncbi:MAG: DUF3126 family protein [Pseudomonadota bacterium]